MWSFKEETITEIGRRFIEGKGYNYWDQYLEIQPDLMVAAECILKTVNNPFSKKVPKKYKCPTGQKCLKVCPKEEENCEDDEKEIYTILEDKLVIGYNISNPITI